MSAPAGTELLFILLVLAILFATTGGVIYLAVRLATRDRTPPPPPEGRPFEE